MTNAKNILIIGGGVSGIILAGQLKSRGQHRVTIVECRDRLGGIYEDVTVLGNQLDIGTFIFPKDGQLLSMFPSIGDAFGPAEYKPGRIDEAGLYSDYPVNIRQSIARLGFYHRLMIGVDIMLSKLQYWRKKNAEEFIKYYIGRRLFGLSGLGVYVERLFGQPARNIHASFPFLRMSFLRRKLSLRTSLLNMLRRQKFETMTDALFQRQEFVSRQRHPFSTVFHNIQSDLEQRGVRVVLNGEISSVKKTGSQYLVSSSKGDEKYDLICSTGALDEVYNLVFGAEEKLTRLSLVSIFLHVRGRPGVDYNILFNFRDEGPWKRAMFVQGKDTHAQQANTYIVAEVTRHPMSGLSPEQLARAVEEDFNRHNIGQFKEQVSVIKTHVTENAYPLYSVDEVEKAEQLADRLQKEGIYLVGREGRFRYTPSAQVAAKDVEKLLKTLPA